MAANITTAASPTPYDGPTFHFTMYFTTISGILSIFGSVFIFVTYCLWADVRTTSRKILVYISFADFFIAVCHISGVWYLLPLSACIVQGFVNICAQMSSTLWTVAIAIYLYVSTARRQVQLAQRMMVWFHLICWFVPLIMACLALGFKALGRSNFIGAAGWCWIRTDHHFTRTEMIIWMLSTDFFWKIIAFVVIVVLYALLKLKLRRALAVHPNRKDPSMSRTYDAAAAAEKKLMLVPLLYLLLYIWALIRFFMFIHSSDLVHQPNMVWLTVLQGLGSSGQGFTNFILYCFLTNRFMDPVKTLCRSCSCWNRNLKSTGEDLTLLSSTQITSTIERNYGEEEPFLNVIKQNYQSFCSER